MVGSFPADRFGRKPMLFLIQFIMIIACLVEMFATQPNHWIAAKVLNVCPRHDKSSDRARVCPSASTK